MKYSDMSSEKLKEELEGCRKLYDEQCALGLKLDLSRGKPSKIQLDLSVGVLDVLNSDSILDSENGLDCRNYGGPDGIPEGKRLLSDMIGVRPEEIYVGNNSSLTLMYDLFSHAMVDGLCGSDPWYECRERKFICPVPGYDRHFAITEHFKFKMIPVHMDENGPDMDMVEELVKDPIVKGIWCVPKYSNPSGITYSDEVVRRFAALEPAAKDFRIFWDNAYCVHTFMDKEDKLLDILSACREAGHPDMVYEMVSTSKVVFPGAGISGIAASPANLEDIRGFMKWATIGPDKLNQLRQARFLPNAAAIRKHMEKQAEIMRPKFLTCEEIFHKNLDGLEIGKWTEPNGGYFISFDTLPGCAKKVVAMCGEAGVKFTPAGSTWPCKIDPTDSNIRVAPSCAPLDDIRAAAYIFSICVKIASIERILSERN